MQATHTTPRLSSLAAVARRLALPTLVLAFAACDDSPTAPAPASDAAFGKVPITSYQGHILYISGSMESIVHMVNPSTHIVNKVAPGSSGSWSPDYSTISYFKGYGEGLWTMKPDGTDQKQIVAGNDWIHGSVFSPDAKFIAFIMYAGLNLQVHKVELATGTVTQLTNMTGISARVSWSKDGKKILFDAGTPTNRNLFTVEPDGSNLTQLTQCKGYCNYGQFSPDGKWIAFIHDGQVARMTAAGTNVKFLTGAADPQPIWPSWSPDGKQIAYERYAGGQHDIWIVNVANGTTAPLITSRLDDTSPNWSR